ncbi:exonuclease V subunit beta [Mannheimia haemolytica]|uniref:Exonuclease V subunit beta n=1 Tax=Mannheimia haemolytica TaxID=75985 RepID=A0A378N4J1_MANHA|nr:exonuclease V subunit beta [Mannheimia haemolytica]
MLHKIYLEQGIIERLKGLENADRLITDLLHLTEILQETSQALESEAELLRWYEKQVNSPILMTSNNFGWKVKRS